jgi:RecB family exonuclease
MTDPFVEQLVEMCHAWPTRAKWVVVPSHATGLTLGDRLARRGTPWANLRFVTPLDLALRMAGPFLVERGITPSEDTLGPALMIRLLLDLPAEHEYFRPVAQQPSMGQALWSTLRELRMTGLRAHDLDVAAFTSTAKHGELVALIESYERYLETEHVADMPAVFEEAVTHLDFCPVQAADCWTELPDTVWPVRHRRLLDRLPGERIIPRGVGIPGLVRPRRVTPAMVAPVPSDSVMRDADHLCWLLRPAAAPPPRHDQSLALFHAGGRDAELEEVFRRVLASGLSLDEVEIACATEEHASLAWEKARRHGWLVTNAYGLAASRTRPGRALLGWCQWIESDFDAASLRHLLQSGDLSPAAFREIDHPEPFSPGQAGRLLLKAEAAWGRQTYGRALGRLVRTYEANAADLDRSLEQRAIDQRAASRAQCLLSWVEDVLTEIPEPERDKRVILSNLVSAADAFLDRNAARASALDGTALVSLRESLGELRTFGAFRCEIRTAVRFVRERVEGLHVGIDRARPGHLFLSQVTHAGIAGRSALFVVGLEEGHVFPGPFEDPVLLDAERRRISDELRTSADRLDEAVFAVTSRLATAEAGHVCLSYSSRDTREFRDMFPSWLVLHAWRLKTGDNGATFDELKKGLGEPVSRVPGDPDAALTDTGWWLSRVRTGGERIRPALLTAFASLARGLDAAQQRASAVFSEFDGLVPEAGPLLDPAEMERTISVTALEGAAACPFRFFLTQGLGVEPLGESARHADVWLDPSTRGTELHALFAAIMREVRDAGTWPPPKAFIARAVELGKARLRELKAELPPPSEDVFTREGEELLHDLELFIREECAQRGIEGIGFEVTFGTSSDDTENLAREEPIVISLGQRKRILLRGRIDRINRLQDGTYEIVDYKTGGFWRDDWAGVFAGGTRLQHALYGLAAAELLRARLDEKAEVRHAAYRFPTSRGFRNRVEFTKAQARDVSRVLRELSDLLSAGAFIHAPHESGCKWCEFGAACGQTPVERAKEKLDASNNRVLDPYRRLRKHE